MAKRLLIIWAIVAGAIASAQAQAIDTPAPAAQPVPGAPASPAQGPASQNSTNQASPGQSSPVQAAPAVPPARLIKRKSEPRPPERAHPRPLDERCRPPKDQLETALQKAGNAHRLFQARLAYNAGNRLCRDGHAERGMAEFQRGLSYLQENPHP